MDVGFDQQAVGPGGQGRRREQCARYPFSTGKHAEQSIADRLPEHILIEG
jgi:hypothetical protein